jgi:hypothetical protein
MQSCAAKQMLYSTAVSRRAQPTRGASPGQRGRRCRRRGRVARGAAGARPAALAPPRVARRALAPCRRGSVGGGGGREGVAGATRRVWGSGERGAEREAAPACARPQGARARRGAGRCGPGLWARRRSGAAAAEAPPRECPRGAAGARAAAATPGRAWRNPWGGAGVGCQTAGNGAEQGVSGRGRGARPRPPAGRRLNPQPGGRQGGRGAGCRRGSPFGRRGKGARNQTGGPGPQSSHGQGGVNGARAAARRRRAGASASGCGGGGCGWIRGSHEMVAPAAGAAARRRAGAAFFGGRAVLMGRCTHAPRLPGAELWRGRGCSAGEGQAGVAACGAGARV